MNISNIKGLKYPEEYFIRFFFKNNLQNYSDKRYLEFGCSNGCNLTLPYQFKNQVIGIDYNTQLIEHANENFTSQNSQTDFKFYTDDMRTFCQNNKNINADVLVLASSIYYIPKEDFVLMLKNIIKNKLIKKNIPFYLRFRLPNDFRNNKDKTLEKNSVIINNNITGEDGVFCKFYTVDEMLKILRDELNLSDFSIMETTYENIQNNVKIFNSDVIIWGTIN